MKKHEVEAALAYLLTKPGGKDDVMAIRRSLDLGRRDNLTPMAISLLAALIGMTVSSQAPGMVLKHDPFDYLLFAWAIIICPFFLWRHLQDQAIHRRAREALRRAMKEEALERQRRNAELFGRSVGRLN